MKALKIIFIVIIVLIIIVIVSAVFILKNLDFNQFRSQIEEQMELVLKREVSIKDISSQISLKEGFSLKIKDFSISGEADSPAEDFFVVNSVFLKLNIAALVTQRKIVIGKVEMNAPKIDLRRGPDGALNVPGIEKPSSDMVMQSAPHSDSKKNSIQTIQNRKRSRAGQNVSYPQFLVKSIRINNAFISYTDETFDPPLTIPIADFNLNISDFSLNRSFALECGLSLWSQKNNIHWNVKPKINVQTQQIFLSDLKMTADLAKVSVQHMEKNIPPLKDVGLKGSLDGVFSIVGEKIVLGNSDVFGQEPGLLSLKGVEVKLNNGRIPLKQLKNPVDDIKVKIEVSEGENVSSFEQSPNIILLGIKEVSCAIGSGKVLITGQGQGTLKQLDFSVQGKFDNLRIEELLDQSNWPFEAQGILLGQFELQGRGPQTKMIKQSLLGEGRLSLQEGRLVDFNIIKYVLSRISIIPNLGELIAEDFQKENQEQWEKEDTTLNSVEIETRIKDGVLFIPKAEVDADGSMLSLQGRLDFQQNLALGGYLSIQKELSASMISSVEELSYFLDEEERIHIPFVPFQGKLHKLRLSPDLDYLGKKLIKNKGKDELKKLIFDALDIEEEQPQQTNGEEGSSSGQEKDVRPEKVLIENILNTIIK